MGHARGRPGLGDGRAGQARSLASVYRSALDVAEELGAKSISMPAISGGTFGFPIGAVADVALRTVSDHLLGRTQLERVMFVLRGDALEAFSRRLRTI
jgi:O-acetyl-ADP-ribose deacetylase (regulator of RNase III)